MFSASERDLRMFMASIKDLDRLETWEMGSSQIILEVRYQLFSDIF